ncbi:MAG: hypothetical protein IJ583_13850, partial [Firmicutes bacterium]|nr:hypothetical protein [Bacillota bacterium]
GKRVPKDVLAEAETIINDYFLKKYNNHMPSRVRNERKENYYDKRGSVKKKIRKRNFGMVDAVMFLSMLLCIVMIVIVVNSVW